MKTSRTEKKKAALKRGVQFSEWVFANKKQKIFERVGLHKDFKKCLEETGIKRNIRFHDLRHTYATTRLLRGHNIGDISYQLGHSSVKITYDVYGHWVPGKFKNEVAELDGTAEILSVNTPYMQPDN